MLFAFSYNKIYMMLYNVQRYFNYQYIFFLIIHGKSKHMEGLRLIYRDVQRTDIPLFNYQYHYAKTYFFSF